MLMLLEILFIIGLFSGLFFIVVYWYFPNFSLKKKIIISCCVGVAVSLLVGILGAGLINLDKHSAHNTKSKYDTDLDNGLDKLYNGETMTEDEENAVNDFYEWNDEQYRNK